MKCPSISHHEPNLGTWASCRTDLDICKAIVLCFSGASAVATVLTALHAYKTELVPELSLLFKQSCYPFRVLFNQIEKLFIYPWRRANKYFRFSVPWNVVPVVRNSLSVFLRVHRKAPYQGKSIGSLR